MADSETSNEPVVVAFSPEDELLLPSEVGLMLRVDPKTVSRWAKQGLIGYMTTLGGHHRFSLVEIKALMATQTHVSTKELVQ